MFFSCGILNGTEYAGNVMLYSTKWVLSMQSLKFCWDDNGRLALKRTSKSARLVYCQHSHLF